MVSDEVRKPAVAGQFYPATEAAIRRQIDGFLGELRMRPKPPAQIGIAPRRTAVQPRSCIGCMLPHAGYMYSGAVAALTLAHCQLKPTIVLFGPNHTGLGTQFSIMTRGTWQTPMGDVPVNRSLAEAMLAESVHLQQDSLAHRNEHSLEVQLPLVQYYRKPFDIVPISFASDDLQALQEVGAAAARAIKAKGLAQDVLLVASSDMTHYQPQEVAEAQDKLAIEKVLALDEAGLFDTVHRHDISMCGYMPTVVMLACAKALGAHKAQQIAYATSGDVTGDRSEVVGYAGIIVYA